MSIKTFSTQAIVLKRTNVGELDRIITFLSEDQGKLVGVAKGVRKLNSSQSAYLEPGNHVSLLMVNTKSLPIVTQTRLIDDFAETKKDLKSMKKLVEVLEIIDRLFPEGLAEEELFQQMLDILHQLNSPQTSFQAIQENLTQVLIQLGYQHFEDTHYTSILDFVSAVAEKPLHSYEYLTLRSSE